MAVEFTEGQISCGHLSVLLHKTEGGRGNYQR